MDVIVRASDGGRLLESLENMKQSLDITFIFPLQPDKILHAHKLILAGWSEIFNVIVYNSNESVIKVSVTNVSYDTFKTLIQFLYGKPIKFRNVEEAVDFYLAAKKYGVTTQPAIKHLISRINRVDSIEVYEAGLKYEFEDIVQQCLLAFKNSTWYIINSRQFLTASPETVNAIFRLKSLRRIGERDLCVALHNWLKAQRGNLNENLEAIKPAIEAIRFLTLKSSDAPMINHLNFLTQDQKDGVVQLLQNPEMSCSTYPETFSRNQVKRKTKNPEIICNRCEMVINLQSPICYCVWKLHEFMDCSEDEGEYSSEEEVVSDGYVSEDEFEYDYNSSKNSPRTPIDPVVLVKNNRYECNVTTMLKRLAAMDNLKDFTFTFANHGNQEIWAHKLLLAAWSNSFFHRFYGNQIVESDTMEILDFEPEIFQKSLDYLYGKLISIKSATEAMKIYKVANKFLPPLLSITSHIFEDPNHLIESYEASLVENLEHITRKCLEKFASRTYRLIDEEQFLKASAETVNTIFRGDICGVSVFDMCEAMTKWLQAQPGELSENILKVKPAIQAIRFWALNEFNFSVVKTLIFLSEDEKTLISKAILAEDWDTKVSIYPPGFCTYSGSCDREPPSATCCDCDKSIEEGDCCKKCYAKEMKAFNSVTEYIDPPYYDKAWAIKQMTGFPVEADNPYHHDFKANTKF